MKRTSTTSLSLIEHCRELSHAATESWHRLHKFVDQMGGSWNLHGLNDQLKCTQPIDPRAIADLAYWMRLWILGMDTAQICENTTEIARSSRAFLYADALWPEVFPVSLCRVFEELLDHTCAIETILLLDGIEAAHSLPVERAAEAIYRSCRRLPADQIR